ncbi:MAG TPA: RsmG family class I SAM-dependent methyltransferase [Acidimicrobiales bacterium]|nr:RsmG family class I SAM-dependent methyltransferase [Acidimicrobiales bacterium]
MPAALLRSLESARALGFLGPGPVDPHVRHAEGFTDLARRLSPRATPSSPALVLDLGSGGGLPGLVLAALWPACSVVLLEAAARRVEFLRWAVDECGLADRARVVQQRAEDSGHEPSNRGAFDGVVARSFGTPAVAAECAAPFLRTRGWLVVSEPPGPEPGGSTGERWPPEPLSQLGLVPEELVRGEFGFQILRQVEACPERFARRNGVPAKRPLF